ncbi:hypothetical protein B0H13DRAFT_2663264 [Mycena leptocephala]|nr:hypothetical protein B0H13DRAFT_2663264 [Mycena leptocephala]
MTSTLSASQQAALAQLRDLTNGGEDDVAVSMLESVDWDVQRAAELIFGTAPPPPSSTNPSPLAPQTGPSPSPASSLPFPAIRYFTALRLWRPAHSLPRPLPSISLSFVQDARPRAEMVVQTVGRRGPSTLTHRAPSDRKVLPDFTLGTYEDALRTCQRDIRIACIVLVSEEHDDVPEFKRLNNAHGPGAGPAALHERHSRLGGDVRDREAYSASLKLQATTYPFVAFLASSPAAPPAPRPPHLILLRPSPSSRATKLLPRVTPFLADRAFRETAARDGARIEALMQAEARAKREAEAARVAQEAEAARVAQEAEERELRKAERDTWRQWTLGH